MSAYDNPHAIQMAHENQSSYQNSTSTVTLGIECHFLSRNVMCPHEKGQVGLRWIFFSFLFSLNA
jgi:hypothetical protein